jgi:MOSC domain-containing protein YiiM
MYEQPILDSKSVGDPARHLSLADLEQGLAALPGPPADRGRVALIIRKADGGRREILQRAVLTVEAGVPGDAWGRSVRPDPQAQLAVMQHDVAVLIAHGQPLALFGDNLFLDLDLSAANLPAGSRLRAGAALLEVTPKAHNGCRKFLARFGADALQFTAKPQWRPRNLRGIYLRVVESGEVKQDDAVEVIARACRE